MFCMPPLQRWPARSLALNRRPLWFNICLPGATKSPLALVADEQSPSSCSFSHPTRLSKLHYGRIQTRQTITIIQTISMYISHPVHHRAYQNTYLTQFITDHPNVLILPSSSQSISTYISYPVHHRAYQRTYLTHIYHRPSQCLYLTQFITELIKLHILPSSAQSISTYRSYPVHHRVF
jgi:hypothetical protein